MWRFHKYPRRRGEKAVTLHPLQQAECQEQMSLKQRYQRPHSDIWSVFSHVRYCMCFGDLIFICFIFAADNKSYSKSKEIIIIIIYISRKRNVNKMTRCMQNENLFFFLFTSFPRCSQMAKLQLCSPLHTLVMFDGHPAAAEFQGGRVFTE